MSRENTQIVKRKARTESKSREEESLMAVIPNFKIQQTWEWTTAIPSPKTDDSQIDTLTLIMMKRGETRNSNLLLIDTGEESS